MTEQHPTVRITDELRAVAARLDHLDVADIAASTDPLTVIRNLYLTVDTISETWPHLVGGADVGSEPWAIAVQTTLSAARDALLQATDGI